MKKLFLPVIFALAIFCSINGTHIKPLLSAKTDTINLPDSYKNRHFITDAQVLSEDPATIPGNIVRYKPATADYEFTTLTAMIKGHQTVVRQPAANGLIYKGEVPSSSSINGSDQIAGLRAEKGQVLDMEIYDKDTFVVPVGQIDTPATRKALQSVSEDDRKNLFYITSATVSLINYKMHPEETTVDRLEKKAGRMNKKLSSQSKNDTAKNGVYLKLKKQQPKTKSPVQLNSLATKILTEKVLSIQVIPVDDLLKTGNH